MDLILKDEVFKLIGAAFEVYNALGPGFLEPVYQEALALELTDRAIPFVEQAPLAIHYKQHCLKKFYVADFLVFGAIVVEIKAMKALGDEERCQLLNYLAASSSPLGLLINFGHKEKLEWQRYAGKQPSALGL